MNLRIDQLDQLLNDFAIRCFGDVADGDYIAARMASRARMVVQYLWASQQAIEKYLKCILLLNRIPAAKAYHDLGKALATINSSGKLRVALTNPTQEFIQYLDQCGKCRYLEISNFAFGADIVTLDRAVWELRRYCTLTLEPRTATLRDGFPAPKVRLPGRFLEKVIDTPSHPAREPLLWQNGYFGRRTRRSVKLQKWWQAQNAPLFLNPQMLDEVLKYVHLPKDLRDAYRAHKKT